MIAHTLSGVVGSRMGVARDVAPNASLDEAVALRRCAMYRKAFRGTAIGYPADALRFDAVASWARNRGVTIDVASSEDIGRARLAGIDASHVVMHCHGEVSASICRAGFSRFVVDCREQIATLADNQLGRAQRVVVDGDVELAADVTRSRQDLVGLHCRLSEPSALTNDVVAAIARMAWIGREHGVLLSRLSLSGVAMPGGHGDPRTIRRLAEAIRQAVEDGCVRFRYPRPALTVSPHRSELLTF